MLTTIIVCAAGVQDTHDGIGDGMAVLLIDIGGRERFEVPFSVVLVVVWFLKIECGRRKVAAFLFTLAGWSGLHNSISIAAYARSRPVFR